MTMNIKEAIEHKGIIMNRVPAWAKSSFKELAKDEFDDNYGQALAAILKDAFEYRQLKNMMFNNELDIKIGFDKKTTEVVEENEDNSIRNMKGDIIGRKGRNLK